VSGTRSAVEVPAAATGTTAPAPSPAAIPFRLPPWAAAVLAVASGVVLLAAFPTYGHWWLAPVAVAMLAVATAGRRARTGALLGLLHGAAFFTPLLHWTSLYVGLLPLVLLAASQAAFTAGLGAVLPQVWRTRTAFAPLLIGGLWVAQEAVRSRVPFGGFPWGRLAFGQGDAPTLRYASLGGAPLVTFAVAAAGGLLAVAAVYVLRRRIVPAAAAVAGTVAVLLLGAAVPIPAPRGPEVTVAVVQGNVPRMGLDFNAQRRAVLDNHVQATLDLARRAGAGEVDRPDLVVWPENSSDIDPLVNADARAEIDRAARAVGVPILVGAVLEGPGERVRNAGIVWDPETGPGEQYVKRHPVPFAEYVPFRSVARLVSDKVDLVRRDFAAGDRTGVLRVGPATVGDVICFEVAYDGLVRDTVRGGAGLLVVQTNNATFGLSAEAAQQLAMVRLRAVEHGRPALMASTTGISATVTHTGRVTADTDLFTRAVLVRTMRLGETRTVATVTGAAAEIVLGGTAVAVLLGTVAGRQRRRPGDRPDRGAATVEGKHT
jgi:apolipoprotein N-acyltransferase